DKEAFESTEGLNVTREFIAYIENKYEYCRIDQPVFGCHSTRYFT
ncbi:unnamed protein product, partial [Rotaria socialis]